MAFISTISRWAEHKSSWFLLFFSAFALEIAALYFQYGMDLKPCIMCIYQRTAIYGILLAGLIVVIYNHMITRIIGYTLWSYCAVKGFLIAQEHYQIINESNPFISVCEMVPDFPSWAPLHKWIPLIFEAKGDCIIDGWSFLSFGMVEWMNVIFAVYFLVLAFVLACRIIDRKTL